MTAPGNTTPTAPTPTAPTPTAPAGYRRAVLTLVAVAVVVAWIAAPYGARTTGAPTRSFADLLAETADNLPSVWADPPRTVDEILLAILVAVLAPVVLLAPLYPAVLAVILAVPGGCLRWTRAAWIAQGVAIVLAAPLTAMLALLAITSFGWGGPTPHTYPTVWALPGLAMLAGGVAIAIGIAPHGRIARLALARPDAEGGPPWSRRTDSDQG